MFKMIDILAYLTSFFREYEQGSMWARHNLLS